MMTMLLLIGLFFLAGWLIAIVLAIRADWREHRERKNHGIQSRA